MQEPVMKQPAMGQNTAILTTSPNRGNIRFPVIKTSKNDQLSYLAWLVNMINEKPRQLQRQYFWFHNAKCCKSVWFPVAEFKDTAYVLRSQKSPRTGWWEFTIP